MYLNLYLIWLTGDIEIITNISPNVRLVLEPHLGTYVMKYVELVYSDGDSNATVRTIKPLDAEEIKMVCSTFTDPVPADRQID